MCWQCGRKGILLHPIGANLNLYNHNEKQCGEYWNN
jgi:hypothetical protein